MNKKWAAALVLGFVGSLAHAGDHGTGIIGDTFCSDENRSRVSFVLMRIDEEKLQRGENDSGVRTLLAAVKANSSLRITPDAASAAGLNPAQSDELFRALRINE